MNAGIHISRRTGAALVAVVALVTYANTIGHEFTWDDHYNVVNNEAIRDLGNVPNLWSQAWGSQASESMNQGINANYWRPVVLTLYALDYAMFGLNPVAFHASNVLWHALACVLLWLLAVRLIPVDGPPRWGLLFGALAYTVHPLHTEVVNVITYRTDLVAGVCSLGALLAWLGVDGNRPPRAARLGVYLWAPLLYALGVGSKEMAVTVPVLVALLDLLFPPGPLTLRDRAFRLAPMAGVLVVYMGIRAALLSPSAYSYFGDSPPSVVLYTMLGVFGLYGRLLLVPWPLNPFYDWSALPFETSLFGPRPLLGLLLLGLWFGAIAWSWRRRPALAFFLSMYLVILIPVSQVVPVVVAAAERFLFVACAGPLLAVGVAAASPTLKRFHGTLAVVGACLLLGWCGLTVTRNQDWRSDRDILEAYVGDWPTSFNAWIGLARLHEREGRLDQALPIYQKLGREEDLERIRSHPKGVEPLPTVRPGANPP